MDSLSEWVVDDDMLESGKEPTPGLSPIRKRLLFQPATAAATSTSSTTESISPLNSGTNKSSMPRNKKSSTLKGKSAQRLRAAICLYFVLCVSLSALLFTWTVTSTLDQQEHHRLWNGERFMPSSPSSTTISKSSGTFGFGNPFRRIAQSRSMMHLKKIDQNLQVRYELPVELQKQSSPSHASAVKAFLTGEDDASKTSPSPLHDQRPPKLAEPVVIPPKPLRPPVRKEERRAVPEQLRIAEDEAVVQIISTRYVYTKIETYGFLFAQEVCFVCWPIASTNSHIFG